MTIPNILLLSSSWFLIENPKVFDKPFKDMKMAYIINASKGVTNLDYIKRERTFFKDQGYDYHEIDLDGKSTGDLRKMLSGYEIVYVTGGNSFYLLKSIKDSGFDKVMPELLQKGVIYMGASAGSYVACPNIVMAKWKHQDKYDHYHIDDLKAMNFVPFLVTVHYKPEYDEVIRAGMAQTDLQVRILTDEQALLVRGESVSLIGKGADVKLK